MSKLVLANEGVFPITFDSAGKPIASKPATGMPISGTIQGEGKLAGVPSLFIRLGGCNLRCIWQMPDGSYCRCDTPYSSFESDTVRQLEVEEVVNLVKHNLGPLKHVVITGGEPLLQKHALSELLHRLRQELEIHITIETNGTLFAEEVAQQIDLFSLSPKLMNSNPTPSKLEAYGLAPSGPLSYHGEKRRNLVALQNYIDLCNTSEQEMQLKFVVGQLTDIKDIKENFLAHLNNWRHEDILLMPLGATREELQQTSPMVLEQAIANGWRFAPRVHIELFGPLAGV